MFGWATGQFTILRNTEETETEDDVDIGEIVAWHCPLGLRPTRANSAPPNSLQPRTGTAYAGRCNILVDLQAGDRIRDEKTGEVFSVDYVRKSPSMIGYRSLRFDCNRLH